MSGDLRALLVLFGAPGVKRAGGYHVTSPARCAVAESGQSAYAGFVKLHAALVAIGALCSWPVGAQSFLGLALGGSLAAHGFDQLSADRSPLIACVPKLAMRWRRGEVVQVDNDTFGACNIDGREKVAVAG